MIPLVLAAALSLAPSPAGGKALYDMHCASCHGASLQGSDAPPLLGTSAAHVDFMLQTRRMPPAGQPASQHPLSQPDIRAVVGYVTWRGHGDPGLPRLMTGNAARGRDIFAESCEQCHGVSARGASVGYATVAPSLMQTQPEQVAEAVRSGLGEMPRFGTDVIAGGDLNNLVSFVHVLQRSKEELHPGGFQLAGIGPVAEGFVAWVFGLGALIVFVRFIGSSD